MTLNGCTRQACAACKVPKKEIIKESHSHDQLEAEAMRSIINQSNIRDRYLFVDVWV
ncbi:hypothetical protein WN943_024567 [Citrus x changshan-huyou]